MNLDLNWWRELVFWWYWCFGDTFNDSLMEITTATNSLEEMCNSTLKLKSIEWIRTFFKTLPRSITNSQENHVNKAHKYWYRKIIYGKAQHRTDLRKHNYAPSVQKRLMYFVYGPVKIIGFIQQGKFYKYFSMRWGTLIFL